MSVRNLVELYQFLWALESHSQQRLSWEDAAQARISRQRAELRANLQHRAMMAANPSGQLGNARLNDPEALKRSGLL